MPNFFVDPEKQAAANAKHAETDQGKREAEEAKAIVGDSSEKDENAVEIGITSFGSLPASGSDLRYPKHADILSDSDYVSFEFFKYKPPFQGSQEGTKGTFDRYNDSADFGSGDNILGESAGTIIMYMPEDVQAEYGANWGGAGFGLLSREIMRGAAGNFDVDGLLNSVLGAGKRALYDKIVGGANQALGTSVTTNQAAGGIEGKIVNPNVEMMYESPEMRGFSLNFKMFAQNDIESFEIRKICNTFKKNMLPDFGNGTFISVPNVVRVTFMTGGKQNEFVSQYKPCAITNVSINYTPDGSWAAYAKGAPVATQLTVQFKELKMLFANDINVSGATF